MQGGDRIGVSSNSRGPPIPESREEKERKDHLKMEVKVLQNKLKEGEEEVSGYTHQIQQLNHHIAVLNERERRLEEMIIELSMELPSGGQGAPPRPEAYSVTPDQAIDAYIQIATADLQQEKKEWNDKVDAIEMERDAVKSVATKPAKEASAQTIETGDPPELPPPPPPAPAAPEPPSIPNENQELLEQLSADLETHTQKAKELKKKQSDTVTKATQKINARSEKIKRLEAAVREAGLEFTPPAPPEAPSAEGPAEGGAEEVTSSPKRKGKKVGPPSSFGAPENDSFLGVLFPDSLPEEKKTEGGRGVSKE